jgi:glycosyltransferase involved in cell wall biosynthesis
MIVIDARMYRSSGIGTYIRHLIPYVMEGMRDERFVLLGNLQEVSVVASSFGNRVRYIHCGAPIYSIAEQFELLRCLPADTKLFWSPHYNIPLFYRGKLLVTVHDVLHLAMPQFVEGVHKHLYAHLLFAALKQKSSQILCDSSFTAHELNRYAGVSKDKISVIHIGISDFWSVQKDIISPHCRPYILYVGNVKPHKNLSTLIRAFELIKDRNAIDLVIVGKKEGFIIKDKLVESLAKKFEDRICFTGIVDDHELIKYYTCARVLVLPSLYEGFGLPPLEAMACGCPVVVSNLASLPEVCGDAAVYFDPYSPGDIAEKIDIVINDCDVREKMRQRGLEQAKLFTWEKCAEETIKVIEHTLGYR